MILCLVCFYSLNGSLEWQHNGMLNSKKLATLIVWFKTKTLVMASMMKTFRPLYFLFFYSVCLGKKSVTQIHHITAYQPANI